MYLVMIPGVLGNIFYQDFHYFYDYFLPYGMNSKDKSILICGVLVVLFIGTTSLFNSQFEKED